MLLIDGILLKTQENYLYSDTFSQCLKTVLFGTKAVPGGPKKSAQ